MIAGAGLLVFDLFMTWQSIDVAFPGAGTATQQLDGWDAWGLLIALLGIGLVAVVSVVYATDVEISDDVRWELWILLAAATLFAVTLVKSLTDAHSAWASYVGVVLAGLVLAGAFLNWSAMRAPKRRYGR
jgi:predicted membrane channel-forming protein YqfA (hemolysin III family)